MHIFISWSGKRAGAVARALDVFLTDVLSDVTTFISHDLGGGTRWSEEIDKNLDLADYGIVCLTKDRLRAPWINYEAGALGRAVPGKERRRVVPLLLDSTNPNDVPQPLSLFNVSLSNREAILMRLHEINGLVERPARKGAIDRRAENAWDQLEVALKAASVEPEDPIEEVAAVPSATTDEEKLDEILSFVRQSAHLQPVVSPYFSPPSGGGFPLTQPTAQMKLVNKSISQRLDDLNTSFFGSIHGSLSAQATSSLVHIWADEENLFEALVIEVQNLIQDLTNTYPTIRINQSTTSLAPRALDLLVSFPE